MEEDGFSYSITFLGIDKYEACFTREKLEKLGVEFKNIVQLYNNYNIQFKLLEASSCYKLLNLYNLV